MNDAGDGYIDHKWNRYIGSKRTHNVTCNSFDLANTHRTILMNYISRLRTLINKSSPDDIVGDSLNLLHTLIGEILPPEMGIQLLIDDFVGNGGQNKLYSLHLGENIGIYTRVVLWRDPDNTHKILELYSKAHKSTKILIGDKYDDPK